MSLYNDVYDGSAGTRIPTADLITMTRLNDESGLQTVDTTALALAAADAEAKFRYELQETYSSSTAWHPDVGADLLVIVLEKRNRKLKGKELSDAMKAWREDAKVAKAASMRGRIGVVTTSELTTPQENTTGSDLPPSMSGIWDDVTPEKP